MQVRDLMADESVCKPGTVQRANAVYLTRQDANAGALVGSLLVETCRNSRHQ